MESHQNRSSFKKGGLLPRVSTPFPTPSGVRETQADQQFYLFSTEKDSGYYEYLIKDISIEDKENL